MPRFYSKVLSRTLAEALEEMTSINPAEQLQVFEELALMRDVAGQAVHIYSGLREARDIDPTAVSIQHVLAAGEVMKEALKDVVTIADTAQRMANQAKDKVSLSHLHIFTNQLVRAAHEAFGEESEQAIRFERIIREQIKLPSEGAEGTTLTPDIDVAAMDESVPTE